MNILSLMGHVQDGFKDGEARGKANRLAALSQQAYGADPAQRRELIGQAIGADPQAGYALQDRMQKQDDDKARKFAGAAKYVYNALQTKNPQAVEGAYQQVRPFLKELTGQEPPLNWTDEMTPALHRAMAAVEGQGDANGMPTGFREKHMMAVAAGYQPGTPEYQHAMRVGIGTEGRASSAGFGFEEIVGADGRKRISRRNPRTGNVEIYDETTGDFMPLGGAPGTPAAAPAGGAQLQAMPYTIDDPQAMPPQVVGAIAQTEQRAGSRPWTANTPDIVRGARPDLAVSMSPAEEAAAKEAGQQSVRAQYEPMIAGAVQGARVDADLVRAPRVAAAEAGKAGAVETAKGAAQAAVESRTAATAAIPGLREDLITLKRVRDGFKQGKYSTGWENQFIPDAYQSSDNQVLATDVNQMILTLAEKMKGTLSDKDVAFLRSASVDLNKDETANAQILDQIMKRVERAYVRAASKAGAGSPGRPPVVSSQAQYDALPSGALYLEDGKTYRKP